MSGDREHLSEAAPDSQELLARYAERKRDKVPADEASVPECNDSCEHPDPDDMDMAPQPAVAPGDVVQLASGGPIMTAEWDTDEGMVCCWWDGLGKKYVSQTFNQLALRVVEKGER